MIPVFLAYPVRKANLVGQLPPDQRESVEILAFLAALAAKEGTVGAILHAYSGHT